MGQELGVTRGRSKGLKPLRRFDFGLVGNRLEGFLINVDRDLQRRIGQAIQRRDVDADRCLSLLNIMVRFAHNSYHAVRFIGADIPEDPDRKLNYVLVVPNVNRQLLDLLFSLVYMLDDFRPRSLHYQRAGWRELFDEYRQYKTRFSNEGEWRPYLRFYRETLRSVEERFQITPEEKRNPKLVPYWKHPFELKDEQTTSREYLRYLNKWLYGDTSAETHLSFGGLLKVAPFMVAPIIGGRSKEMAETRLIQQYRYLQISRTAIVTLAIATEIDRYCHLGNREAASYLWTIFAEYSAEAQEMRNLRYAGG